LGALSEETLEGTITGASAIVIDSTSTNDERTEAINGFAEDIRNMSGERIVAIAVGHGLTLPKNEFNSRSELAPLILSRDTCLGRPCCQNNASTDRVAFA
jgi:hypothetical protein